MPQKLAIGGATNNGVGGVVDNVDNEDIIDTPVVSIPPTYTYKANTISIQKGVNNINYSYTPDEKLKDSKPTVAYEYSFGNTMDKATGVNLKSIDTTGVEVSYYYSPTKLDTTKDIIGETDFTLQRLENNGSQIYIYILVSPINQYIPTSFSTSLVWYYGIPTTITYNANGESVNEDIIFGQEVEAPNITPTQTNGYNFMGWYIDEACTIKAEFPLPLGGKNLYAKFPNLPEDYLGWDETSSSYYVKQTNSDGTIYNGSVLPADLYIPATYNDGVHGLHNVTTINAVAKTTSYINTNFDAIKSVYIPATITNIVDYPFNEGGNLYKIVVDENNPKYDSRDNCNAIIETDTNKLILGSNATVIPDSVTSIGAYAFFETYWLYSINLPKNLTSIGENAFHSCFGLAEVYNLSSLPLTIGGGEYGFVATYADVIHTTASTPTRIREINGIGYCLLDDGTYSAIGHKFGSYIILDANISKVNQFAFIYRSIISVDMSRCNKLHTIEPFAFAYSNTLRYVLLPSSLVSINNSSFTTCKNLVSVDFTRCSKLTLIGNNAFESCSKLKDINLSRCKELKTIDAYAFYNCSGIVNVNLSGCSNLAYIASYAFRDCISLTNLNLDNCTGITNIGYYTFLFCHRLLSVDLSDCTSLNIIGTNAFAYCYNLTQVKLPTQSVSIETEAFRYCYSLLEVYIPSSLIQTIATGSTNHGFIGYYAKVIHTSLSSPSKLKTIDGVIYYIENANNYIALTASDNLNVTSVVIDERTTKINTFAFYRCYYLVSVDLSKCTNLQVIDVGAFYDCVRLTDIDLSSCTNLTTIGTEVFTACVNLVNITIPSSVTKIGIRVFKYCNNLISLNFSGSGTWYKTTNEADWNNMVNGEAITLGTPQQNAIDFKSEGGAYCEYFLYKK